MKISKSILALIAFVAIFMTILTEARLGSGRRLGYEFDEDGMDEIGQTYMSNGYKMNMNNRLANPSRAAQQAGARYEGAFTNKEATSIGVKNYRNGRCTNCDEDDDFLGGVPIGPIIKVGQKVGMDYMSNGIRKRPSWLDAHESRRHEKISSLNNRRHEKISSLNNRRHEKISSLNNRRHEKISSLNNYRHEKTSKILNNRKRPSWSEDEMDV